MSDASRLVLVMGDQLSLNLSSLQAANPARDRVLMVEVMEETTYVPHHQKKIAFILSSMRHFAERLRGEGWTVDYVKLDDPGNTGSFTGEVERALSASGADEVLVTHPSEWRVLAAVKAWTETLSQPIHTLPDDRLHPLKIDQNFD